MPHVRRPSRILVRLDHVGLTAPLDLVRSEAAPMRARSVMSVWFEEEGRHGRRRVGSGGYIRRLTSLPRSASVS